MESGFRKSMAWLHTWAGVVVGSVLFAIFWMGTLSVFDREIDRWMMPATRIAPAVARQPVRLDGPVLEQVRALTAGAPNWLLRLPDERTPVIELDWPDPRGTGFAERRLHPQTGAVLRQGETLGATGFIYPFHISLHLRWRHLGDWLVGLAAMAMLALVVSGVVIHRKIFASFFLFRPTKKLQRASLDLHNLAGVLGLPFHFGITFSGLVLFVAIYWPSALLGVYGASAKAFVAEAYDPFKRPKAGRPATAAASLDRMRAAATAAWDGVGPDYLRVWHPGDANSFVEMRRGHADTVTLRMDQIVFDAATGAELHRFRPAPVLDAQRFVGGLHMAQFRHWTLRWLYFAAGLSGCVLIVTGFVFWLEARRASHAKKGLAGVRAVEALVVFSVPGLIAATLAFLVANRLLPEGAALGTTGRAALEVAAFYLAWVASLGHAAWRGRGAWREQTFAIAGLALAAVLGNGVTTQAVWAALGAGQWASAGVDLGLLVTAGLALTAARALGGSRRPGAAGPGRNLARAPSTDHA